MRSVRACVIAVCVLLLLRLGSAEAAACSCVPTTIAENIERAGAIFAGKVTAVSYPDEPKNPLGERRLLANVEVSRVWKGESGRKAVISTWENLSSCDGYNLREGQEYLVFADTARVIGPLGKEPEYRFEGISWCGGTTPLNHAADELKALGEGRPPRQPAGPPSNNGMHPTADSAVLMRETPWLFS
jgi:hypothetical protein